MEQLTWTGSLGPVLNPLFLLAWAAFFVAVIVQIVASLVGLGAQAQGTTMTMQRSPGDWAGLAFRVSDMSLVCATNRIHESLPLPRVTRVPGTKPFILGLANVRGNLVTVVDLGGYLYGSPTPVSGSSRLLLATLRGRPVGLLVDEVHGQRNFMSGDADTPEIREASPWHALVRKQHRAGTIAETGDADMSLWCKPRSGSKPCNTVSHLARIA